MVVFKRKMVEGWFVSSRDSLVLVQIFPLHSQQSAHVQRKGRRRLPGAIQYPAPFPEDSECPLYLYMPVR
jgi:hypothetical protein